jgi:hypothetical protein
MSYLLMFSSKLYAVRLVNFTALKYFTRKIKKNKKSNLYIFLNRTGKMFLFFLSNLENNYEFIVCQEFIFIEIFKQQ